MLEYKINKKDANETLKKVMIADSSFNENYITIKTNNVHKLLTNNKILLRRNISNNQLLFENYINIIDDYTFNIPYNKNYKLFISDVFKQNMKISINGEVKSCLHIVLSNPHNFIENRDKKYVDKVIDSEVFDLSNLKDGDTVLLNNTFLYTINNNNGIIALNKQYLNIDTKLFINYKNDIIELDNCIVPITITSMDDQYNILWVYDESNDNDLKAVSLLTTYTSYVSLFKYDDRFINFENNKLRDDVEVFKHDAYYSIEFANSSNFGNNLFQEDIVNEDFVEKEQNNAINPYVNMEKYVFSPACYNSITNKYESISEIEFNFHFRDRSNSDNWSTNDSLYWNSYDYDSTNNVLKYRYSDSNGYSNRFFSADQSDLIGYLNFTNNDVLYQKSKIKKSFIRLLFYDKPDIATQRLLFYSTVFIDSGILYGKYANNIETEGYISNSGDTGITGIGVYNEYNPSNDSLSFDETKRLSTRLTIHDKYNNTACSEGFYIYLFAETAPLYNVKQIYMKVEFNHAGYGRTIPFIFPTDSNNIPIEPVNNTKFPITYVKYDWSEISQDYSGEYEVLSEYNFINKIGNVDTVYSYNNIFYILTESIDMAKLYNDIFIKINIKYDDKNKRYIWFLPRDCGDGNGYINGRYNGKLIFNLFEPKVQ